VVKAEDNGGRSDRIGEGKGKRSEEKRRSERKDKARELRVQGQEKGTEKERKEEGTAERSSPEETRLKFFFLEPKSGLVHHFLLVYRQYYRTYRGRGTI